MMSVKCNQSKRLFKFNNLFGGLMCIRTQVAYRLFAGAVNPKLHVRFVPRKNWNRNVFSYLDYTVKQWNWQYWNKYSSLLCFHSRYCSVAKWKICVHVRRSVLKWQVLSPFTPCNIVAQIWMMLIAKLRRWFYIHSDWLSPGGASGGAAERPKQKTCLPKHFFKTTLLPIKFKSIEVVVNEQLYDSKGWRFEPQIQYWFVFFYFADASGCVVDVVRIPPL